MLTNAQNPGNVLSISPFLVLDDNTRICMKAQYIISNKFPRDRETPPKYVHISNLHWNTNAQHIGLKLHHIKEGKQDTNMRQDKYMNTLKLLS